MLPLPDVQGDLAFSVCLMAFFRCATLMCMCILCRFYWIDPIAYAQNAIAINEFTAPRWKALKVTTGESVGDVVLGQRQLPNQEWWIWLAVGVIAFAWALFQIGNWANHAYLDCERLSLLPSLPCQLTQHHSLS